MCVLSKFYHHFNSVLLSSSSPSSKFKLSSGSRETKHVVGISAPAPAPSQKTPSDGLPFLVPTRYSGFWRRLGTSVSPGLSETGIVPDMCVYLRRVSPVAGRRIRLPSPNTLCNFMSAAAAAAADVMSSNSRRLCVHPILYADCVRD